MGLKLNLLHLQIFFHGTESYCTHIKVFRSTFTACVKMHIALLVETHFFCFKLSWHLIKLPESLCKKDREVESCIRKRVVFSDSLWLPGPWRGPRTRELCSQGRFEAGLTGSQTSRAGDEGCVKVTQFGENTRNHLTRNLFSLAFPDRKGKYREALAWDTRRCSGARGASQGPDFLPTGPSPQNTEKSFWKRPQSGHAALCLVIPLCPTLHDPPGCTPPGSSVYGNSPS